MSAETNDLAPDTVIANRYRIVRKLGAGGMGAVYEAVQIALNRKVALKMLHSAFAENGEIVARFHREAQAAASLGHPNIVSVTDFGATAGEVYLVMDHLSGQSLGQLIDRESRLSVGRTAWIASQVLAALTAAHGAQIVHRDMKPDNVFLTEVSGVTDVVKVLDFGIARFMESETHSKLTATGAVLGTPAYMSPEQARGRTVDHRTDLYAVGVMMYEMLTGRLPFQATNYNALLFAILEETPAPIHSIRTDVPQVLVSVVERAMARDMANRFQSCVEMRAALEPFVNRADTSAPTLTGLPAKNHSPVSWDQTLAASSQPSPATQASVGYTAPNEKKSAGWVPWAVAEKASVVALGFGVAMKINATAAQNSGDSQQLIQMMASGDAGIALMPHPQIVQFGLPVEFDSGTRNALSTVAAATTVTTTVTRNSLVALNSAPIQQHGRSGSAGPQNERSSREEPSPADQPSAPVEQQRAAAAMAAMAPMVQPSTPVAAMPPMGQAVAANEVTTVTANGTPRPAVRFNWVPSRAAGASTTSLTTGAATPPGAVAHRHVQPAVSGGRFPGGIRESVGGYLQPLMHAITNCANRGDAVEGDNRDDGWSMDFEIHLSPQGRVRTVDPHGLTTLHKPAVVACVRSALFDQQLADEPAPEVIEIDFFNRYN